MDCKRLLRRIQDLTRTLCWILDPARFLRRIQTLQRRCSRILDLTPSQDLTGLRSWILDLTRTQGLKHLNWNLDLTCFF